MEIIKADLKGIPGIPPTGLCIGVQRAGAIHKKLAERHNVPLKVWSLRPEIEFLAYRTEDVVDKGVTATGDLDSLAGGSVIFGARGAPPQIRKKAADMGLEILADATCPYVTQQEEAAEELLSQGYNLAVLSNPTHHGIPRLKGIAEELGRPIFIIENEDQVETINLTRFEPLGVIVQTTFWVETYQKIIARILDRFANVHIRNTTCIDALQRLPEIVKLAGETDAMIIFGWNEGMTNRMLETAHQCAAKVYKIEKVDDIRAEWFQGLDRLGIIGSNETPNWMVDDAVARIRELAP